LARTCQAFQEPALNFLWREQDTLVNVLKCLPSHLWEEAVKISSPYTTRTFRITGAILPADWDVALAYAFRVQELRLHWSQFDDTVSSRVIAVDVLETISSQLPRDHLFPNLKKLWFQLSEEAGSYINIFLGPKIIDADIYLPSNSHTLLNLPLRYPELRRLVFCGTGNPSTYGALSKIALSLNRIEALRLPKLDRVALEHVSRLPSLQSLRLDAPALPDLGPPTPFYSFVEAHSPSFSALRDLDFESTTIEFAIEFLQLLSNCCLVSFHVGTAEPATKSTTRQFYAALASHLSHSTLQTLYVLFEGNSVMPTSLEDTPVNYVIDGFILAKLFCFVNLTNVELAHPVGFDIDDTTAWDIARAWPRVRVLSLTGGTDLRHPSCPRMSLLGLKAFANHCPQLVFLAIAFDASTVPSFHDSPGTISQSYLTELNVDIAPINDPLAVATFMSALFPSLTEIGTHKDWIWDAPEYETDSDDEEDLAGYNQFVTWKMVEEMLRIIKQEKLGLDAS
ncbi:hypothetical protein K438DRAFT_2038903, partial [Mycena galopus ATCC 62051]